MTPPVVLAIAASDSGGGAGLAADLATFAALGVHGACVVTAVTAQDTTGVHSVHRVPLDQVAAQLDAVLGDLRVDVVKTGMLADAAVVRLVAERCAGLPIVVDPVLRATTGAVLADEGVVVAYREHLLPAAALTAPNVHEASALAPVPGAFVTTGSERGVDVLARPGHPDATFTHAALVTENDHGTGCTFSSAAAAYLAHGLTLPDAVDRAGRFVLRQLEQSRTWSLGRGRGPIAHVIPTHPTTRGAR